MPTPLRVLFVEDREDDVELLLRKLRRGDYEPEFERVDTDSELRAALQRRSWEVVLSDWHMPHLDAPAAVAIVKEVAPELPVIIVSGTVGEDIAVEAMRKGAQDFVTKDKLPRLLPAIERELREATLRKERRRLQEQLVVSDRMASMGTLAAGVAHEINNPLAALVTCLEFAADELSRLIVEVRAPSEGLSRRLETILEPLEESRVSAGRIRDIVRDLRIFSRSPQDEARGPVDVTRVLDSTVRMAWNEIRHRSRLVKEYAPVPPVLGSESRLGQVFLNLVVNAAQAIREGRAAQNEIRVRTGMADGNHVLVEIRDTGVGVPPENLTRIFDAFYTTKPAGVGTGLGLAICQSIVAGMGGKISVQSTVGVGTTFRLELPVAMTTGSGQRPAAPTTLAPSRRGRILVIDDEAAIGAGVRRVLQAQHDVEAMTSAREALARLLAGERFDVILCDLMMPDVTGMDFHAEVCAAAPELAGHIVFMTGGAFTVAAREFLDRVDNPRLEKPFAAASLRFMVNSLIG